MAVFSSVVLRETGTGEEREGRETFVIRQEVSLSLSLKLFAQTRRDTPSLSPIGQGKPRDQPTLDLL
jgi:hypothetical protein